MLLGLELSLTDAFATEAVGLGQLAKGLPCQSAHQDGLVALGELPPGHRQPFRVHLRKDQVLNVHSATCTIVSPHRDARRWCAFRSFAGVGLVRVSTTARTHSRESPSAAATR